jgi:pimeloyl-ACP methyl ester carboxylesterase
MRGRGCASSVTRSVFAEPIVFGHSMGGPIVLLYGARHSGHAAGLIVQSGFARWDAPRLVEGFRSVAGDEVADIAGRSYRGETVPDEEWARVSAAFGLRVPDKEQGARTPKNLELHAHGMELIRRLDIVDQLSRVGSPTLVSVGELDPPHRSPPPKRSSARCPKALRSSRSSTEQATSRGWTPRTASGR